MLPQAAHKRSYAHEKGKGDNNAGGAAAVPCAAIFVLSLPAASRSCTANFPPGCKLYAVPRHRLAAVGADQIFVRHIKSYLSVRMFVASYGSPNSTVVWGALDVSVDSLAVNIATLLCSSSVCLCQVVY